MSLWECKTQTCNVADILNIKTKSGINYSEWLEINGYEWKQIYDSLLTKYSVLERKTFLGMP